MPALEWAHTWTNTQGTIYLRNLGYPLADGYSIRIFASVLDQYGETPNQSFAVLMNGQKLGEYKFDKTAYYKGQTDSIVGNLDVAVPSSLLRAAGPDPTLVISDTSVYPTITGAHGIAISTIWLQAPALTTFTLPPITVALITLFTALLLYINARRKYPPRRSLTINLRVGLLLFGFVLNRTYLLLGLVVIVSLLILFTLWIWRRELANWLLHLRHPDDERFRVLLWYNGVSKRGKEKVR